MTTESIPSGKRLLIPKLQIDVPILEGTSEKTVHRGVWHRPQSSTPDRGSNTVLVGHRFTYSKSAIFYHLDKLRVGDEFGIAHNGSLHTYRVRETKTVGPNETSIESPSSEPIATLYTCTPLWSAKNRLVVVGEEIGVRQ